MCVVTSPTSLPELSGKPIEHISRKSDISFERVMKSNPLHINRTGIAAGSASACSRQAQRIAGDRGRHGVEHADEELRAFHNPAPTQTALKTSLSIDSPVDAIRSGNFKIVPSPGFRSGETSGTFSSRKEESGMPPANLPDRHPENRTRSIHSFENTKIYEYFQDFIRYPLDFCFDFIHNIRKCERFDSEKYGRDISQFLSGGSFRLVGERNHLQKGARMRKDGILLLCLIRALSNERRRTGQAGVGTKPSRQKPL